MANNWYIGVVHYRYMSVNSPSKDYHATFDHPTKVEDWIEAILKENGRSNVSTFIAKGIWRTIDT